jgi:hypothetical protein
VATRFTRLVPVVATRSPGFAALAIATAALAITTNRLCGN